MRISNSVPLKWCGEQQNTRLDLQMTQLGTDALDGPFCHHKKKVITEK